MILCRGAGRAPEQSPNLVNQISTIIHRHSEISSFFEALWSSGLIDDW